jgi:hypothetical protein
MEQDLVLLLQETAVFLWKDWPRDMNLSNVQENGFTLNGTCPHCGKEAAFPTVTDTFDEHPGTRYERMIAACRCIACNKYILGGLNKVIIDSVGNTRWAYQFHYPLGQPDDYVSESIPEGTRLDFQEALRCRWVDAYNATIEMCRRALESSCIEQGADKDLVLAKMIDWVHGQGKITTPLKDMAHKIKLGGNRI